MQNARGSKLADGRSPNGQPPPSPMDTCNTRGITDLAKMETNHIPRSTFLYRQIFAIAVSCVIPFCTGATFGITAVMLPQLREDKSIQYNPDHESWIASITILSLIFGSIVGGQLIDSLGRKAAHILVAFPFIVGWVTIAFSNSTSTIIVGRFFTGFSSGANKVVTMVYIAEITEPNVRSVALLIPSVTMLLGIWFSHFVGYNVYWKTCSLICLVPVVICLITSVFLKESPLWFIGKGKTDEGIQQFRWFRGTNDMSEVELKKVLESQSDKPKISAKETFKTVCTKAFIKPMLVTIIILLNIHLSGLNVLNFYSLDIFGKVFKGKVDPYIMMMTTDCIRIFVAIAICIFGKLVPKKIKYLTSNFGNSISVFGLVACFMTGNNVLWISVTCLVIYVGFSSAIVTIGWTYVPELLPSSARGLGSGFNSAISYLLFFVMVKTTPDLLSAYGVSAVFVSYGISTLVCGIILCFVLPETNGKTLQSIEDSYKSDTNKNSVP